MLKYKIDNLLLLKCWFSKSESIIVLRSTFSGFKVLFVIKARISLQFLNVSRHLSFFEPIRVYSTSKSSLLSALAPRSPVSVARSKDWFGIFCCWCCCSSSSLSYNSTWLPCPFELSLVLFEFYEFYPLFLESSLLTPELGRIGLCCILDDCLLSGTLFL